MDTLHLDLTQTATRQHIRDVLIARLTEGQRAAIDASLSGIVWESNHFHDAAEVKEAIESSGLDRAVCRDAKAIYDILAQAEAQVHGVPVDQAHFHEVGNAEAVKNVLAICLAINALAPGKITATPIQTGFGKVQCAHGLLDIPAPATAAILARGIPVCSEVFEGERCTPTSAAIIAHFVEEFDR